MKRIIKLTESQLTNLIIKALNEEKLQNINPKNLKVGDGGANSPKKNDVITLQQKLINLGFLKTNTGKPTGYFGNLTASALQKYNSTLVSKNTKPKVGSAATTTTTPTTTTTTTTPTTNNDGSFFDRTIKKLKNLIRPSRIGLLTNLPVHWRAFMDFLYNRTTPIDSSFFTQDEMKVITDKVENAFKTDRKCKRSKSCNVSFYDDTDFSKIKTGEEKVMNVGLAKAIGLTIGNGQVTDNGNSYIVKDIYDFNNFKNNPEAYTYEKAPETIKAALKKVYSGNFVQGIEELASYKHKMGYKGIPVEIEIPKTTTTV